VLFNSLIFPAFFVLVIIVYYQINLKWQNRWLLIASYFFYGWWDWRFCTLLIFSTVLDWTISHALHKTTDLRKRKQFLTISLLGNLGVLGFFKYFNFFAGSLQVLLANIGFNPDMFTLNIILPMGISFYTFQTLAYTIDVYRGKTEPADDFTAFALYVSFFPQLVAGPIERAKRLLPQLTNARVMGYATLRSGIPLIMFGYFKKVVIADSLSPLVESTFNNPGMYSNIDLWFGVYAFAIQIYCDFSGYTDIARGIARMLGIELMSNFSAPYFSRSITEFWRRWHISLSSWLKDYLYVSLGGNRKGKTRTYANLMVTMLIGGLWHGAAWTFVIWGGIHGLYLAIHKLMLKGEKPDIQAWGVGPLGYFSDLIKIVFTFHLVSFTWVFFRAPSFDVSIQYLKGMIVNSGELTIFPQVSLALIAIVIIDIAQRYSKDYSWVFRIKPYWRYVLTGSLLGASILVFGWHYSSPTPFIYFQF
jgi:alginate O-acetyltransferase complex protein AlgI